MIVNKKNNTVDYIFIILLLLNGGSILKVIGLTSVLQLLTVLIMFVFLVLNNKIFIKKTGLTIGFLIVMLLLINLFHFVYFDLDNFFSNQLLNFSVIIIIGVLFSNQFYKRESKITKHLNNVLKVIIIHAILSSILLSLFPTQNILFKSADQTTAYVGYSNIFFQRTHISYAYDLDAIMGSFLGLKFYRAHGVFWEPGVFATYVNIFAFINFFIFKRVKHLRLVIPSLFLAWSTAGFIVFFIQGLVFLRSYKKGNKKVLYYKFIFGSIAFCIIAYIAKNNLEEKLSGEKAGSAAQRYTDTMGAINTVIDYPLVGIGLDFQNFARLMKSNTVNFGNKVGSNFQIFDKKEVKFSNSFLRMFVHFGIPLGLFLAYSLYRQNYFVEKKGLFFLITMLSLFSSPILFLGFHFSLVISGLRKTVPILKLN